MGGRLRSDPFEDPEHPANLNFKGMQNIVAACRATGVKKVVRLTGLSVGLSPWNPISILFSIALRFFWFFGVYVTRFVVQFCVCGLFAFFTNSDQVCVVVAWNVGVCACFCVCCCVVVVGGFVFVWFLGGGGGGGVAWGHS